MHYVIGEILLPLVLLGLLAGLTGWIARGYFARWILGQVEDPLADLEVQLTEEQQANVLLVDEVTSLKAAIDAMASADEQAADELDAILADKDATLISLRRDLEAASLDLAARMASLTRSRREAEALREELQAARLMVDEVRGTAMRPATVSLVPLDALDEDDDEPPLAGRAPIAEVIPFGIDDLGEPVAVGRQVRGSTVEDDPIEEIAMGDAEDEEYEEIAMGEGDGDEPEVAVLSFSPPEPAPSPTIQDMTEDHARAYVTALISRLGGPASTDRLQAIKGIGPKIAKTLNAIGITNFRQLGSMSDGEIDVLAKALRASSKKIRSDGWIAQARVLHEQTHGEAMSLGRP